MHLYFASIFYLQSCTVGPRAFLLVTLKSHGVPLVHIHTPMYLYTQMLLIRGVKEERHSQINMLATLCSICITGKRYLCTMCASL